MTNCQYCHGDYANPFKYSYSPLWFAWYPVNTNKGVAFMKKVHRHRVSGSNENFAGAFPMFWNEYKEHET